MASKRLAVMDAVLRRFRAGFGGASELGVLEGDASGYLWQTQPHITTATRLGDRFMAVDDSDTDDSTEPMTATDCRDVLMKGTAINRWHVLPDATSLVAGTVVFVLRNWSSEIRGVRNSDNTLWLRIMPSQTAVVFLTEGGTAAGVWGAELSPIHPDYGCENVEDFVGGVSSVAYLKSGIYGASSGTGASVSATSTALNTGGALAVGVGRLYPGTDNNGGAYWTYYVQALNNLCTTAKRCFVAKQNIYELANTTDDFKCSFGFGDSLTVSDHTDGAWIEYDHATEATYFLRCISGGNSATKENTAVEVGAKRTLHDINIEIASDSSRVDFWIDKTHAGTMTGDNIPVTGEHFGVVQKIYNTAGTSGTRDLYCDTIGLEVSTNVRRS